MDRKNLAELLEISNMRFFALVKAYRANLTSFSTAYIREKNTRSIFKGAGKSILKKLSTEKKPVENRDVPIRPQNYSYIKDRLAGDYKQQVSLPTIIGRARKNGFYLKQPQRSIHGRRVLTHYAGELIQHDSPHHLRAPTAGEKWYLITSLDDFSRYILYARLSKKETARAHILSVESLILKFGIQYSYYVGSHSIFRFVQERDSVWRKHNILNA